jgi:hypothetical protein
MSRGAPRVVVCSLRSFVTRYQVIERLAVLECLVIVVFAFTSMVVEILHSELDWVGHCL